MSRSMVKVSSLFNFYRSKCTLLCRNISHKWRHDTSDICWQRKRWDNRPVTDSTNFLQKRSLFLTAVSCSVLNRRIQDLVLENIHTGLKPNLPDNRLRLLQLNNHVLATQSIRSKKKKASRQQEESDDESDEEESEDNLEDDDDSGLPKDYRTLKTHVKSLRADALVGAGLNIARSKIEDYFYGSKLRLNGEKLLKKSKQVHEGDILDLVTEVREDKLKVKRVLILGVESEKSRKDKFVVKLRAWRGAFEIDNPDVWKPEE